MSFANTSILINRQVPEFVREEYPLFITFLEAYYEFLEQKQTGQKNDLTQQAKNLRNIPDVDLSIDNFENSFFNTFASLVPRETEVSKDFLIKNLLPLYLAKGNEAAFKLLFRLLYNDEVSIQLPKDNILRLSDGKWSIDNLLKIKTDIRSVYTSDGSNTTFFLAQPVNSGDIDVYVNGSLQQENLNYVIRKETKKIIFNSAPAANSIIKVDYNDFDIELLTNRKITGLSSGATAIVERAVSRLITDRLNFGLPFELFVNSKTLVGSFENGEEVESSIIDSNGNLIKVVADTFSILTKINVIDGGTDYNVGDPVLIVAGGAVSRATAEVESVSSGVTTKIQVNYGGAGFKTAGIIKSQNLPSIITGAISSVNILSTTANTYIITDDVISSYLNILISAPNYGFPGALSENVNSRLVDALTPLTITDLGPITNATVIFSNTSINTSSLDSEGAIYQAGSSFFDIKNFRSVGRIDVYNGGTGYRVGDEVIFGNNPANTYGYGAAAAVSAVSGTGTIRSISVQAPRITGTANITNNGVMIVGTNTNFNTDLQIGDKIIISGQDRYINAITSSTQANVNVAFTITGNNYSVGSYARGITGGVNYTQNNFPTVNVSTAFGGSGANIAITSLMGDGESLTAIAENPKGVIQSIKLTSGGEGYKYIPQIDLTGYGAGNAIANATLGASYTAFPGRWTTTDSIISTTERRLEGEDYYINFSYVTSSLTSFKKYKNILKDLLHPSGFVNYALFNRFKTIETTNTTISIETSNTISGFVNTTNGSIFIVGTGTKFNVANTRGILTLGSNVSVNGQIRTISSIISNTNVAVSSAFSLNSNTQTLKILT